MDRKITVITIIVVAMIFINLIIFSGYLNKPQCIKDVCFYGTEDPYATMKAINAGNSKIIIMVEVPEGATQTGSYIVQSVVQLSSTFALKEIKFISIAYNEKEPVECFCEYEIEENKFELCETEINSCLNTQPGENEFMIHLKYPDYLKNEVHINGNTIEVRAKSGIDQLAIATIFKGMI